MSKKLTGIVLILSLIGLLRLTQQVNIPTPNNPPNINLTDKTISTAPQDFLPAHPQRFFDPSTFYPGIEAAKATPDSFTTPILGGVIPHHLLPSFIIADFFHRLSAQDPATIILIGPNHYEAGKYNILTSRDPWATPLGNLNVNEDIVNSLLSSHLAAVDEPVFDNEHSIGAEVAFIKYYMPQAKIVPIILKHEVTAAELDALSDQLAPLVTPSTVLVSSVDFSHYLTSPQAQLKDQETQNSIQTFNYQRILSYSHDHLDSPGSIVTLLKVMQKLGATNSYMLYHTNSGEILKQPFVSTTSYFCIAYFK